MSEQVKQHKVDEVQMPELALRCAQFFMSLSESCLDYYHKYKEEKERKTKLIKKNQKKNKGKARNKNEGDGENADQDINKKVPKKPLTAYIIYFQEKKPKFVEKHPSLNLSELTKLIAKQWKEINDHQRKPYLDQAHEQRKRYQKELQEFRSKYGIIKEIQHSESDAMSIEENVQVLEKSENMNNEEQESSNQVGYSPNKPNQ